MSLFSKVSWKDGMFLLPQHFQQAERSQEAALALRFAETPRLRWGVTQLRLDEEALAARRVRIITCRAVFPDGLTVDMPAGDPEPETCRFELPLEGNLGVYLTVPAPRHGVPLIAERGDRASARFLETTSAVALDQDLENRQEIEVAEKNLRIKVSAPGLEGLEGLNSIKIAAVRRGPGGEAVLDEAFVPASPMLAAAPGLVRRCRDLLGAVAARSLELTAVRQGRGSATTMELHPAELPDFLFLSQLNLQLPVLRQLLDLPGTHPAELYAELLRLAGGLATFALQAPLELPSYQHEAIGECFAALEKRLRQLLGWKRQERWQAFPFKPEGRKLLSNITAADLLAGGEFFLMARGSPGAEMDKLPKTAIMGELGKIEDFVDRAYQGVRMDAVPRPPAPVTVHNDARYFRVQTESPHWAEIRKTGKAALVLPPLSYTGIQMELIGVVTGGR